MQPETLRRIYEYTVFDNVDALQELIFDSRALKGSKLGGYKTHKAENYFLYPDARLKKKNKPTAREILARAYEEISRAGHSGTKKNKDRLWMLLHDSSSLQHITNGSNEPFAPLLLSCLFSTHCFKFIRATLETLEVNVTEHIRSNIGAFLGAAIAGKQTALIKTLCAKPYGVTADVFLEATLRNANHPNDKNVAAFCFKLCKKLQSTEKYKDMLNLFTLVGRASVDMVEVACDFLQAEAGDDATINDVIITAKDPDKKDRYFFEYLGQLYYGTDDPENKARLFSILEMLVSKFKTSEIKDYGPLQWYASAGHYVQSKVEKTLLYQAIAKNDQKMVKLLLPTIYLCYLYKKNKGPIENELSYLLSFNNAAAKLVLAKLWKQNSFSFEPLKKYPNKTYYNEEDIEKIIDFIKKEHEKLIEKQEAEKAAMASPEEQRATTNTVSVAELKSKKQTEQQPERTNNKQPVFFQPGSAQPLFYAGGVRYDVVYHPGFGNPEYGRQTIMYRTGFGDATYIRQAQANAVATFRNTRNSGMFDGTRARFGSTTFNANRQRGFFAKAPTRRDLSARPSRIKRFWDAPDKPREQTAKTGHKHPYHYPQLYI